MASLLLFTHCSERDLDVVLVLVLLSSQLQTATRNEDSQIPPATF